jgi:glycosyltransferase involved in cell wall biosynthesis
MISIAMTTYNGAQYLKEQIESIQNQTIQDFELIICDDCSSDNTFELLQEYALNDSRITVLRNNQNLGFKRNFEKVIGLCKGDYIALSDQDDIWFPNHLEILENAIKGNVMLSCARPIFVDENNKELPAKYDYFKMDYVPSSDEGIAHHIFLGRSTFQGASMMIKKSFFDIALPIPDGANYHDSWFAGLACFAGGIAYVDVPVMRYRRFQQAVTSANMKLSPARLFVGAVLVNHSVPDRLVFIENIRKRVSSLSIMQLKLLDIFDKILKRRNTILGRIANVPYLMKHFKEIYCYDGKHLFSV